jgi:inorganic pyrophosphatase
MKIEVVIETAKGEFFKRNEHGDIDFISPIPSPFNYGSVAGIWGEDGDLVDALVLGPKLSRGDRGSFFIVGRVQFVDAGMKDDKWICSHSMLLSKRDRVRLILFFRLYARCKRFAGRLRGSSCQSYFLGIDREQNIQVSEV